ncbi:hypothetical protein ABIA35_003089 [Catenulispora sp. MAP12-49]|uniref:hypothetical protein n=1 Tax=unclassified Catenulispora TaxID=414885 RepID=UPI003519725C
MDQAKVVDGVKTGPVEGGEGESAALRRRTRQLELENAQLTASITEINRISRGTCAAPIHAELLLGAGIRIGRNRVAPADARRRPGRSSREQLSRTVSLYPDRSAGACAMGPASSADSGF